MWYECEKFKYFSVFSLINLLRERAAQSRKQNLIQKKKFLAFKDEK